MTTPKPQNEPTMEEILASIRKIISEDAEAPPKPADATPSGPAPAPTAAAPPPPPPPSATPAREPAPAADSVLELTDMVKDDGTVEKVQHPSEDLMMTESPEPAHQPAPAAASAHAADSELLSARSAAAAASALAGLAGAAAATRGSSMPIGNGQKTIEDLVREMLRPLLKDWLDANLPPLVERLVQREIAKLAGHVDDR